MCIYVLPRILNRDEPTICGFGIFTGTGNTWYSLVIFICVFVIFWSLWNCRVVKLKRWRELWLRCGGIMREMRVLLCFGFVIYLAWFGIIYALRTVLISCLVILVCIIMRLLSIQIIHRLFSFTLPHSFFSHSQTVFSSLYFFQPSSSHHLGFTHYHLYFFRVWVTTEKRIAKENVSDEECKAMLITRRFTFSFSPVSLLNWSDDYYALNPFHSTLTRATITTSYSERR